ncbi:MAG: polysaccharide pyruvyl transferase CsaB [Clostridia bacterium]|nr:polysaccharide pyruvyl transferase CsaB [Clostridia bacterium]
MKVIHIAGGGDRGGAKTHIISLCSHLAKSCELILVSLRSGDFAESAEKAGIKTKTIFSFWTIADYIRLIGFIKREKPDIVHCHGAKANLAGVLIKLFCKCTTVTTVHSDYRLDYMHSVFKNCTIGLINRASLRFFDYYITVSELFKRMLITRSFKANNIMTIYNGLDFSQKCAPADKKEYLARHGLEYNEGDIVIGIPARLNPVKDIPTLISAFAKAKKQCSNIKLLIGGDGEEMSRLKHMVKDLGIQNSVAFLGWVSDVPQFFTVCDIDVLCSISESFPYSILEGIREGCAVITSDVGGMRNLIDNGINGYIFKPGDSDVFADYIIDLVQHPDKRRRFASLLYEKASRLYSIDKMANTQLEIYESISKLVKRRKKRDGVLICGAYGRGNSGDEAILKAIITSVKSIDPLVPVTVMTRQPLPTSLDHGVNAVYTFNAVRFLSAMRRSSLFINGGGNLIQDSTSSRSLFFYLYTIYAAKKRGCKVLMYGCGIGHVRRSFNRRLTKKVIDDYVDIITLRDEISKNDLIKMGVTKPEISLTADPAMSIKPYPDSDAEYYLRSNGIDPDGKYICFSLRQWGNFKNYDAFAKAAEYAYKQYGATPVFLPIEIPKDMDPTNKVCGKLTCPHYILPPPSDAALLISVYGKMSAVCAIRLHALVFAAASGAPFMAASYDIKVNGFMEYIGMSELCCDLSELSFDWLKNSIDKIYSHDVVPSPANKLRELEKGNIDAAKKLLNDNK